MENTSKPKTTLISRKQFIFIKDIFVQNIEQFEQMLNMHLNQQNDPIMLKNAK
jgi:hypothetical protein